MQKRKLDVHPNTLGVRVGDAPAIARERGQESSHNLAGLLGVSWPPQGPLGRVWGYFWL